MKTIFFQILRLYVVEMVGDQEFCSYPDYDCSTWCIWKNK